MMIGDLPDRFRFVSAFPLEDGRWILNFESDVNSESCDSAWLDTANKNAVFRAISSDRELVKSLKVGDKFHLRLSPLLL